MEATEGRARGAGTGPASERVLLVLGSSAGGVARHVAQLARALSDPPPAGPGAAVRVAGPADLAGSVAPAGGRAAFDAVPISDRPHPVDVVVVLRLRKLAAGAGVLHAHGLRAGALAVLAARSLAPRSRPRVVVTLHNLPVGGRGILAVSGVLERVVGRGADAVLGVSGTWSSAPDAGARESSSGRSSLPRPDRAQPRAETPVRRDLGVPTGTALIVTVARLAPQKGLGTLLEAAALLDPAAPVRWIVAGDGPLRGALETRRAELRAPVQLVGSRSDVPDLFAAADVVVSTAVWEGQPISIQEALQLGAPLVATDAGGTREVTGDDAAILVPVGDAAAIARAVSALLADPSWRSALGTRARFRAADLPTPADVVGQLRRVYGWDGGAGDPPRPVE